MYCLSLIVCAALITAPTFSKSIKVKSFSFESMRVLKSPQIVDFIHSFIPRSIYSYSAKSNRSSIALLRGVFRARLRANLSFFFISLISELLQYKTLREILYFTCGNYSLSGGNYSYLDLNIILCTKAQTERRNDAQSGVKAPVSKPFFWIVLYSDFV